ncbi:MAG: serine hydroxymethyltransferase, partial [Desulfobacteraceae bacterium]|nr:serine hydroxymethyltransferase [Desulfobacteraceae bacterium]
NFGFDLVSGGTDNHLILIDLNKKGITGRDAEEAMGKAGIVMNKNTIPFDKRGPKVTSGLRLGTPALTTRGMREAEMKIIAGLISKVLENPDDEKTISEARNVASDLCHSFPILQYLDEEV